MSRSVSYIYIYIYTFFTFPIIAILIGILIIQENLELLWPTDLRRT
jgi:hypothetical protein